MHFEILKLFPLGICAELLSYRRVLLCWSWVICTLIYASLVCKYCSVSVNSDYVCFLIFGGTEHFVFNSNLEISWNQNISIFFLKMQWQAFCQPMNEEKTVFLFFKWCISHIATILLELNNRLCHKTSNTTRILLMTLISM